MNNNEVNLLGTLEDALTSVFGRETARQMMEAAAKRTPPPYDDHDWSNERESRDVARREGRRMAARRYR
jgi:uncharacterized membrane protein (UPF0182 family)